MARLAEAPDEFLAQRRALAQKIEEAETARSKTPPTPAPWRETALAEAERAARAALERHERGARNPRPARGASGSARSTRLELPSATSPRN